MIELDQLMKLALGQLRDRESDLVEEHVLCCGHCASTLEHLLLLGDGVRDLVSTGSLSLAVSGPLLARLDAAGLISRSYRLLPDQSVACSVGATDVYVLTTLAANLRGVECVDVVQATPFGEIRMLDVPFDAEQGIVQYVASGELLRTLPTCSFRVELFAADPAGERSLGAYVFNHTA